MTKKHELGGWGGYKACGRREGTLMWRNRVVYFYRIAQLVVVVGPDAPPPDPLSSMPGTSPRRFAAASAAAALEPPSTLQPKRMWEGRKPRWQDHRRKQVSDTVKCITKDEKHVVKNN